MALGEAVPVIASVAALSLCLSAAAPARDAAPARPVSLFSVYTSLDRQACKVKEHPTDEEPSQMICPGVAGYSLKVDFADAREGLSVLDPSGRKHDLDFMGLISTGFSALGPKAEWRMDAETDSAGATRRPTALITRFTAQAEDGSEISYLAVAKITTKRICLVKAIPPGPGQNAKAREAADGAAGSRCMESRMHPPAAGR